LHKSATSVLHKTAKAKQMRLGKLFKNITKKDLFAQGCNKNTKEAKQSMPLLCFVKIYEIKILRC
jgi:hypothetical protein